MTSRISSRLGLFWERAEAATLPPVFLMILIFCGFLCILFPAEVTLRRPSAAYTLSNPAFPDENLLNVFQPELQTIPTPPPPTAEENLVPAPDWRSSHLTAQKAAASFRNPAPNTPDQGTQMEDE